MASIEDVSAAGFLPVSENNQALQPQVSAFQTRLKMAWNSETNENSQGRKSYKRTVALLLSWTNSDLSTGEEVSMDRYIFTDG
jgi:hypothetical protein